MGETRAVETKVVEIKAANSSSIYVEVIDREVLARGRSSDRRLPEGAEPIGSRGLSECVAQVNELIGAAADMVSASLAKIQPEEMSAEINVAHPTRIGR